MAVLSISGTLYRKTTAPPATHTDAASVGRGKANGVQWPNAPTGDAFCAWVKRATGANMQLLALPGVQLIRQLGAARDAAGHSSRVLKTSIRRAIYTRDAVSAPFASPHISLMSGRELRGNVFNSRRHFYGICTRACILFKFKLQMEFLFEFHLGE